MFEKITLRTFVLLFFYVDRYSISIESVSFSVYSNGEREREREREREMNDKG